MDLEELINKVSKLSGRFVLRSGKISNTYFDKYEFEAFPEILKKVVDKMSEKIIRKKGFSKRRNAKTGFFNGVIRRSN
jgi:orotate phosphoribosyltransferase